MKQFNLGAGLLLAITVLFFAGCHMPGMISNLQDQVTALEIRMDAVEADLDGVHGWMITTDEQLAAHVEIMAGLAEDIVQLRIESEAGDAELQSRLNGLVRTFWSKYREIMGKFDDVIDQQNEDRAEYRRGLIMVYMTMAHLQWDINILENAFNDAAEDFQDQLDALDAKVDSIYAQLLAAISDLQDQIDDINIDLATKITLAQSEMETYRILFGDIAIDEYGNLKPYYADKMYYNGVFQGYSRVLYSLLYQLSWGISHDGYNPPDHAINSIVSAFRDYYLTIETAQIVVDDIYREIGTLNDLYTALEGRLATVEGDYLQMADYLILMATIDTLRSDMDAELATKLSVYTFQYNKNMIFQSISDLANIPDGNIPVEFKLDEINPADVTITITESVSLFSVSKTGNLTFNVVGLLVNELAQVVDVTITVNGYGTVTFEDYPVYKLALDGNGRYPSMRIYGGYSLVIDSQFGSVAKKF